MESTFRSVLNRYLEARSSELDPRTRRHYSNDINSLIDFLAARHPEIDSLRELERTPHIEGWLREMKSRQPPYSSGTCDQRLRHVRTFFEDIRTWGWPESPAPLLIRCEDFPDRRQRQPWQLLAESFPDPHSTFDTDIKRYLDIRGATLRPSTIRTYRQHILEVVAFLQASYPSVDSFAKLERRHVEGWLAMLATRKPSYGNATRRMCIRYVRRFFEDLRQWGWPSCPRAGLISRNDFPPPQKYLPRPLPNDVDKALMAALEKKGDVLSLGLAVARRTGLRIGELSRLEVDCVTENPHGNLSLRVPLGKLRREREIPIDDHTATLVKMIRAQRDERPKTTDPDTGRPVVLLTCTRKGGAMHPSRFRKRLKQIARECGIDDNVHPHRLRHSYATEMLRHGVSLPGVMKLLGHTTMKMTMRYVEITNVDLGRDYLKAIESAGRHYARLDAPAGTESADGSDPMASIEAAFDQLVARLQAARFDQPDPSRRKRLRRLVERLRRAQKTLPDLIR